MNIYFKYSNIPKSKTNELYITRTDIKGKKNKILNTLNVYLYIYIY